MKTQLNLWENGLRILPVDNQKQITYAEAKAYAIRFFLKLIESRRKRNEPVGKLAADFLVEDKPVASYTFAMNQYTQNVINEVVAAVTQREAREEEEDERLWTEKHEIEFEVDGKPHQIDCTIQYKVTVSRGDYFNPTYQDVSFEWLQDIETIWNEDGKAELDIDLPTLVVLVNQEFRNFKIEKA